MEALDFVLVIVVLGLIVGTTALVKNNPDLAAWADRHFLWISIVGWGGIAFVFVLYWFSDSHLIDPLWFAAAVALGASSGIRQLRKQDKAGRQESS